MHRYTPHTPYHNKQQGDTRAATRCEHTSSVMILHVSVPLCFHGCWLNVQITVFSSGLFWVLFILFGFIPTSAVSDICLAYDVSDDR